MSCIDMSPMKIVLKAPDGDIGSFLFSSGSDIIQSFICDNCGSVPFVFIAQTTFLASNGHFLWPHKASFIYYHNTICFISKGKSYRTFL